MIRTDKVIYINTIFLNFKQKTYRDPILKLSLRDLKLGHDPPVEDHCSKPLISVYYTRS
jgi:hypothetical protein